jgi:GxxExxY protein
MCADIVKSEYKYSEITGKILASAFEVFNTIGCGFTESVYHRSLVIEFNNRNIQFHSEYELPIFYKNQKVGARRADFLIEKVVTVEIKAVSKLEDVHLAQAINYLEAFNIEIGMLINFGAKSLEYKRLANSKLFKHTS